jgi:hypothetical protein
MNLSFFVVLAERNINADLFNAMLSFQDLSLLICSCKTMKFNILKWKSIFPIEHLIMKGYMSDKKLENMILHYSNNVRTISWSPMLPKLLTLVGYQMLSHFQTSLTYLEIRNCIQSGLPIISSTLYGLKILKITNYKSGTALQTSEDLCSISRLTNLVSLSFHKTFNLDDATFHNYSTLSQLLLSISIVDCKNITRLGLIDLVETFCGLTTLTLISDINAEDFFCLTALTSLTALSVGGQFDNSCLKMVCCKCKNITSLDIQKCPQLTPDGFNSIHYLTNLQYLSIDVPHENDFDAFYNNLSQYANIGHLKIEYPIELLDVSSGSDVGDDEE